MKMALLCAIHCSSYSEYSKRNSAKYGLMSDYIIIFNVVHFIAEGLYIPYISYNLQLNNVNLRSTYMGLSAFHLVIENIPHPDIVSTRVIDMT